MRKNALTQKSRILNIFTKECTDLIYQKNILDLGSHTGDISNFLLNLGAKSVTGIEKRKDTLDIAKNLYPKVNFVCMDIEDKKILEYFKNTEVVFCLAVLYLLKNQEKLFLDISKNTNIKTVIVDNPYLEKNTFITMENGGEDVFFSMLSVENLEKMFKNSGFKILTKKQYLLNTEYPYMKNRILFLLNRD